jgi:predicted permease
MPGDLRLAIRSLAAAPAVSLAALLTLALGIGATTAIFSVANGLFLRPLAVERPQELVTITSVTPLRYGFQAGGGWNYGMWDRFRQRSDAFGGAFAWTLQRLDLAEAGEAQPVNALIASGAFFTTLGVRAARGRMFAPADDVRGGGPDGPVAVISHDLWQHRFNAIPAIVGSQLLVEGMPLTIVGVAPPSFRGVDVGQPFDIAMPFGAEAVIRSRPSVMDSPRALLLTVLLRLAPGQTPAQATAALQAMQSQIIGPAAPSFLREPFIVVRASTGISDRSRLRQQYAYPLLLLSILSGIVLLIACTNIASLFLARAAARRRALSIRLALGASRWRLARLVLVEAGTLGIVGVLAATLLATWMSRALVAQLPNAGGPVLIDLPLDWRVLAFTAAAATIAVAVFATAPALYAMQVPPMEALQDEGRSTPGGRAGVLPGGLLVTQVALSIVLVSAGGLFLRTAEHLANVPLGFDPRGVLVITTRATSSPAQAQLRQRILDALSAVPGVTHVAASIWTPVGSGGGGILTDARGRRAGDAARVAYNVVTPGWFRTYATPLRMGRDFERRDDASAPRVAVVNDTLRRSVLGGAGAPGAIIDAGPCGRDGCTVVGVVADAVYGQSLRDAAPPTVYVPFAQAAGVARPDAPFRISVRTDGDPVRLAPALATALRGVDPALTFSFRPVAMDIAASMAEERLVATLAAFFGAIALLLSSVGLYGVTSYAVARRRGEIAIRLMLGGQPRTILRAVLARIAAFVLAGTVAGLLVVLWLSRFLAPLLFGLEPNDPATLVAATLILGAVAALAGGIPAWRATHADPAAVLREN